MSGLTDTRSRSATGGAAAVPLTLWKNAVDDGGLDPTGASDQSAALATFYASVPTNGVAYFPAGTYQGLHAPGKSLTILGDGKHRTTFIPPPSGSTAALSKFVNFTSSLKCEIRGVKLNAQSNTNIIRGVNNEQNGGDKNITVADCWFENFNATTAIAPHATGACAIYIWTADAALVENNDIVDCIYNVLMDSPGPDCRVKNNRIWGTGTNATGTATSTTSSSSLTAVSPTTGWANNMQIQGPGIPAGTTIVSGAGTTTMVLSNAITGTGAAGIAITGSNNIGRSGILMRRTTSAYSGSLVEGNTIENMRSDPGDIGGEGHGIDLVRTQGVRVLENSTRDTNTAGIHVGAGAYGSKIMGNDVADASVPGLAGDGAGIYVELNISSTDTTVGATGSRESAVVSGNTIYNGNRYGISLSYSAGTIVSNNIIFEHALEGIFSDSDRLNIKGNVLYNNFRADAAATPTSTPNVQAQLRITVGTKCVISNNVIFENQATPVCDYGIAVSNNAHTIMGNQATGTVAPIFEASGGATNYVSLNPGYLNATNEGTVTLVAGTATVTTAAALTASRIFLTKNSGTSTGALRVSARTNATSFVITSSDAADTSTVAWRIENT